MKKATIGSVLLFFAVGLAGCGSAGSIGPPPPPAKTVTSVTAACAPTTLQLVASGSQPTSQCTWAVNYSDGTTSSLSSLVTLTVSPSAAGTISAAGLFAPSASVSVQTQVTVTATSMENTAKSGTATITVNPVPPAVAVSVTPTTASVQAGSATPVQFTATVLNATNTNVTWSVNGVNGGNATFGTITAGGAYTAPATVPSPTAFPVTATSVADTTKSASAAVTITQPPAPTITVTPRLATVKIGSTQNFTVQTTNATSAPTCVSLLFGNVPVSGSTASYTVPASITPPVAFADTVTCTATNSTGQSQASASVTLEYPVPIITSVSPQTSGTIYVRSGGVVGNFEVNGSGFANGGGGTIVPDEKNLVSLQLPSWNQFLLNLGFGVNVAPIGQTPFNPGFFGISATSPPGHGGGTSNIVNYAFLGDQDTLVFNGIDEFQVDQAIGTAWKFKLSDGSADGSFNVGAKITSVAIDEGGTGLIIAASSIAVNGYDPTTGLAKVGTGPGGVAVAARKNNVCFVNGVDAISCADFSQLNPSPLTAAVAGTPWNIAMTTLGGNLTAVAWTIESDTLMKFSVPSLNATGAVMLTGLTPASKLPPALGGWQLQVFNSGPSQGVAAVLPQFDRVVVFVNLTTMTESKRVTLTGLPFRMGKNEVDGSVVVALADPTAGLTRFVRVAPDGTVTNLVSTVPFLATGFQVDGTKLLGANRGQSQIGPNQ